MTLDAMVASRLCHDFANPLGAIANGVELLNMIHPGLEEVGLVESAVKAAIQRIDLYRVAFGAAPAGADLAGTSLSQTLGALGGARALTLSCRFPDRLPRADARRIALAALCAETAMPWGGALSVTMEGVEGHAPRLRHDADLWRRLAQVQIPTEHETDGIDPGTVHFALLARDGVRRVAIGSNALSITL